MSDTNNQHIDPVCSVHESCCVEVSVSEENICNLLLLQDDESFLMKETFL